MRRGGGGDSFLSYSNYYSSMATAVNPCGGGVVCPKPRRLVNNDPFSTKPSRILSTLSQQLESSESSGAGTELLDIIIAKGNYGTEKANFQVASSPPFFCGSPPVRASNPLIQDEHFGIGKMSPLSPSTGSLAAPPTSRNNIKCGNKPAPVRIEGFNCRGISAVMA